VSFNEVEPADSLLKTPAWNWTQLQCRDHWDF